MKKSTRLALTIILYSLAYAAFAQGTPCNQYNTYTKSFECIMDPNNAPQLYIKGSFTCTATVLADVNNPTIFQAADDANSQGPQYTLDKKNLTQNFQLPVDDTNNPTWIHYETSYMFDIDINCTAK